MSSLVLLTIGSLLISQSALGIPVPAPPAATNNAAATASVLAPSAGAASATLSISGVATTPVTGPTTSLSSDLQAASTATTSVSVEEGLDLGKTEEPSIDGPLPTTATSAASSSSETSSTGISALSGMSTKQLAIYCGIGLAVLLALGAGWFFFQKYQKKKKGGSEDDDDDDSGKNKSSDFDDSDDSDDESEDEKPTRSKKEKYTAPLPSAKLYQQAAYVPTGNMAGTGAHGYGYENALRHNSAMDVYPVDPSLAPSKPSRTVSSSQHPREKPVQRSRPPAGNSDDSSDESDEETEEERKRRQRREAKKKAKRSI